MNNLKEFAKKIFSANLYQFLVLCVNYYTDLKLYSKHSSVFNIDTYEKIESEITLRYHSIEKGFLHQSIRHKFAKLRVIELIELLKKKEVVNKSSNTQIQSSYNILCKYFEFHQEAKVDISDYFSSDDYQNFKSNLLLDRGAAKHHKLESFFKESMSDFKTFSNSRSSVRNFTGEKVPEKSLQDAVDLANNAPSVCNRQTVNVYVIEDKYKINEILEIQGGLRGSSENLSQLIVLTGNRNYFYSAGERNQLYIDGGIYLMNLLYALHYYKIGACPAHWGLPVTADKKAKKILGLKESEQIICVIAIGNPVDVFSTALSLRKKHNENLRFVQL
ncbi:MAG: nitroreductase family protein [Tissierellia bacterium]|nr:nitroreductase family protein [Tissierellia bacterium]